MNRLVILFAILMITIGQSVDIYVPSMPSMVVALHSTAPMVQLSVTIALIGYGSAAMIWGPLSDYFGRRFVALNGLGIFVVGGILCMFASNIYWLLIGRALQGLGFASSCGVAAPMISDTHSGENLVKAFSYVGMVIAIVPVVAPVLGGYLQHAFGWHAPFIFLFLYAVTILCLFFKYFPETNKQLKQSSIHPVQVIKTYFLMLKNLRYVGFLVCLIFVFAGEIYYVINAPFLLQNKLGFTPVQNGWLVLITVAGFLTGTFSSTKLCKRFSVMQLLLLGCGITLFGTAGMLVAALFWKMTVITIVVPMMFYMLGAGLIYPNAISGCVSCFPEKTGAACSLSAAFNQGIGGLVATLATQVPVNTLLPLALVLFGFAALTSVTCVMTKMVKQKQ